MTFFLIKTFDTVHLQSHLMETSTDYIHKLVPEFNSTAYHVKLVILPDNDGQLEDCVGQLAKWTDKFFTCQEHKPSIKPWEKMDPLP